MSIPRVFTRPPVEHKERHQSDGPDAMTPGDIQAVPEARKITAGTGLSGGGNLTADRTLAVKYGTTAGTAAQGNDARLTNARTPTAHKATHKTGGADALTPADIGALAANGKAPTAGTADNAVRWNGAAQYKSTAGPSGGADNDIWLQYF